MLFTLIFGIIFTVLFILTVLITIIKGLNLEKEENWLAMPIFFMILFFTFSMINIIGYINGQ